MSVLSTSCIEGEHVCDGRAPRTVDQAFSHRSTWGKCDCECHRANVAPKVWIIEDGDTGHGHDIRGVAGTEQARDALMDRAMQEIARNYGYTGEWTSKLSAKEGLLVWSNGGASVIAQEWEIQI